MAAAMEEEREAEQAARQGQQVHSNHYHYICLCCHGPCKPNQTASERGTSNTIQRLFHCSIKLFLRSIMCHVSSWLWLFQSTLPLADIMLLIAFLSPQQNAVHCLLVSVLPMPHMPVTTKQARIDITPRTVVGAAQPTYSFPLLMQSSDAPAHFYRKSCVLLSRWRGGSGELIRRTG